MIFFGDMKTKRQGKICFSALENINIVREDWILGKLRNKHQKDSSGFP
jgi:hypothetical protein